MIFFLMVSNSNGNFYDLLVAPLDCFFVVDLEYFFPPFDLSVCMRKSTPYPLILKIWLMKKQGWIGKKRL